MADCGLRDNFEDLLQEAIDAMAAERPPKPPRPMLRYIIPVTKFKHDISKLRSEIAEWQKVIYALFPLWEPSEWIQKNFTSCFLMAAFSENAQLVISFTSRFYTTIMSNLKELLIRYKFLPHISLHPDPSLLIVYISTLLPNRERYICRSAIEAARVSFANNVLSGQLKITDLPGTGIPKRLNSNLVTVRISCTALVGGQQTYIMRFFSENVAIHKEIETRFAGYMKSSGNMIVTGTAKIERIKESQVWLTRYNEFCAASSSSIHAVPFFHEKRDSH